MTLSQPDTSKPVIYRLLLRLADHRRKASTSYGSIEKNDCRKFNDLSGYLLKAIKNLVATHQWLTGVPEQVNRSIT